MANSMDEGEIWSMVLLTILGVTSALEMQPLPAVHHELILHTFNESDSPSKFPQTQKDPTTPIVVGPGPKAMHLPPKRFPQDTSIDHPVLSGSETNITQTKNDHEARLNATHNNVETSNTSVVNTAVKVTHEEQGEEDDMLHTQYKGGQDVDEMQKPLKKATEKDEKKPMVAKKEPSSEVDISEHFDKNGPKLMNDTKSKDGESIFSSASQMVAVSSSVLSNTQPKHHGIIEPAKTIASVVLTGLVILCLGGIGLLVWKRITQRRHGRDVLINEDDMDDVADMHTFDSAQIQIT